MAKFEVVIADDSEHEFVFAEMYLDGKYVGQISQELGRDMLQFEYECDIKQPELVAKGTPLDEFRELIDLAVERLAG